MDPSSLNVLVVDDVSVVRSALGKALGKLGILHFQESDNILDAWEKIKTLNIDLIFCDWNMPNGDGIELLNRLRADEDSVLKFKKFIMITGSEDKAFAAMDAGAHNIIHKPFQIEDIEKKIRLIFS